MELTSNKINTMKKLELLQYIVTIIMELFYKPMHSFMFYVKMDIQQKSLIIEKFLIILEKTRFHLT